MKKKLFIDAKVSKIKEKLKNRRKFDFCAFFSSLLENTALLESQSRTKSSLPSKERERERERESEWSRARMSLIVRYGDQRFRMKIAASRDQETKKTVREREKQGGRSLDRECVKNVLVRRSRVVDSNLVTSAFVYVAFFFFSFPSLFILLY